MNRLRVMSILLSLCAATMAGAASLTLSPNVKTVETDSTLSGGITLDAITPVQLVIPLTSSHPSAVSVPSSVTVRAGSSTATFKIDVNTVTADTLVTITAAGGAFAQSRSFTVLAPPRVIGFVVSPDSVAPAQPVSGTATLSRPATHGGVALTFTSSNLAAATVPTLAEVPSGASTITVPVSAKAVTATSVVTIRAARGSSNAADLLTVHPSPAAIASISIPSPILPGTFATAGTVTLDHGATGDSTITYSSDHPNVRVPASSTIRSGELKDTFTMGITALPAGSPPVTARITATLGASSKTATVTIEAFALHLTVSLPQSVSSGASALGRLSFDAPAPQDVTIGLTSASTHLSVPPTVTIPSGQASASFAMTAAALPVGAAPVSATLTATYDGSSRQAVTTIRAPLARLASLTIPSPIETSAPPVTGQVTLAAASQQNETVALGHSAGVLLTIPASVVIPAGQTSATFEVRANIPAGGQSFNTSVTALLNGETIPAMVTLRPPPSLAIATLNIEPQSVLAGSTATGMIRLTAAAPATGQAILLTGTTDVTIPDQVTVPAGDNAVSFSIATRGSSSGSATAFITARLDGVLAPSLSSSLSIRTIRIERLVLTPATVTLGMGSASGRVEISEPAPESGLQAALSCRTSSSLTPCPPSLVQTLLLIPAGQRSIEFPVPLPGSVADPNGVTWTFQVVGGANTTGAPGAVLTITPP